MIVQPEYDELNSTVLRIVPSDRCKYLSEILDKTILSSHHFRRMKYYQIPCQKHSPELKCFYDDFYFCLCYQFNHQYLSNCFNFNSKLLPACYGLSECENGGQCIQDKLQCSKLSICLCPKCFHGTRCQFNSHLSGLSLDSILGYHIRPYLNINHQSFFVKFSLALTTLITIIGIVNGTLSFLTYKNENIQKTGCGFYLLGSSITTLFTMVMFALKFIILIHTQINYITNLSFLKSQCYTMDFLLRIGLNMDQYLHACVALERTLTVIKGVNFNKKQSKHMAKYIVIILLFWTISTTIHDPIHRRLLEENNEDDDEAEKRIWCIVTYSSRLQTYNTIINFVHFFIPFISNFASALIIILMNTRQKVKTRNQQSYRTVLRQEFQTHKHLLISPILLIILALPRLILPFISDCMKSASNVWIRVAKLKF